MTDVSHAYSTRIATAMLARAASRNRVRMIRQGTTVVDAGQHAERLVHLLANVRPDAGPESVAYSDRVTDEFARRYTELEHATAGVTTREGTTT